MNLVSFANKSIVVVYTTGQRVKGYAEYTPSVDNDDEGDILTLRDEYTGSLYEIGEKDIKSIHIHGN